MLTAGPRCHFPFCIWPFEGYSFFFYWNYSILLICFFCKGRTIFSKGKKKCLKCTLCATLSGWYNIPGFSFRASMLAPVPMPHHTCIAHSKQVTLQHRWWRLCSVTPQHRSGEPLNSQRVQSWADRGGCISWNWISVLAKWVVFPQSYLYFKSNHSLNSVPPPVIRIGYVEPQKWVLNVSVVRL